MKFSTAHKNTYRQIRKCLTLSLSDVVFIMLINVKMPTIVGILTFMSRINFVLSWLSMKKSLITSGLTTLEANSLNPDQTASFNVQTALIWVHIVSNIGY